jgi:hypothetical protein
MIRTHGLTAALAACLVIFGAVAGPATQVSVQPDRPRGLITA